MNDNQPSERQASARIHPGSRVVRRGFSVCLFIVVLAVFSWVIHRRLSQYDSIEQTIHQSTAIKACLTKRNPISLPSMHGVEPLTVFLIAFAFTATLRWLGSSEASLVLRVLSDRSNRFYCRRWRPGLVRFSLLPPPSLSSVL